MLASVAEVSLTEELFAGANLGDGVTHKLLGYLAYGSESLKERLTRLGIALATERADQQGEIRQQKALALASLKRVLQLSETVRTLSGWPRG